MEAIKEVISSNAILALLIVAAVYWIGEFVGNITKAWVPSVFVIAVLFLAGYWTIFPTEIVATAGLGPPLGGTLVIMLCIIHMGTMINIKQLLEQWKVIVVCLAGLAGMMLFVWFIGGLFIDKEYIIAALPPLTGGIVAATTMQAAALEAGLELAALLAIAMYIIQGFAGYPLTAIMLKIEGKRLLTDYRSNGGVTEAVKIDEAAGNLAVEKKARKKLIPYIPEKFTSTAFFIMKIMAAALLCSYLGKWTGLSQAVWALIIGVILTELGFLEQDILNKAKSYGFLMFVLMVYVFDGLKNASPSDLLLLIKPILVVLITGLIGMALFAIAIGLLLKVRWPMAIAVACTALYGFPPNAILTEECCKALAETPEEKDFLMGKMLPMMIVGGFTTVTITSVIIAGVFAGML